MREITTDDVPEALGPYSQAIVSGNMVHVSGKTGVDPDTGEAPDSVGEQTTQTLENVAAILEAAGTTPDAIVSATVYLTDMDDYDAVNEAYRSFLSEPYPARTCVEVSRLPAPLDVEITVTAELDGGD
ncbi:reactive intermediate/imine deaminase [Halorubrum ezzemoulense]|uniref:2-iminobutanoate/2-iminopropanoate deaminase n=1 Tax=Halorubrum ezzemoulense TaxID=337243 RepID=A0A256KUC0_HALEZ|nr:MULTISPECIES: Rid family detoxifying hydrolase [Halorubrum]OYR62994.1 reactive intermediate/imine deaminase [Halorubrum ezzemoulense]OYR76044.1 reactive intermediate/imine deaminase [Halorubrum ezzemoulense]OYR84650.1 reactive intermediate/imine deaminase [Halorubrum ezzemoulense]QAY21234.1 RidA family protein [Halorubrum ezzemoulense]TKX64006.1 RidA family protein [Halorubrum sp. GN12_10-3_MGM]